MRERERHGGWCVCVCVLASVCLCLQCVCVFVWMVCLFVVGGLCVCGLRFDTSVTTLSQSTVGLDADSISFLLAAKETETIIEGKQLHILEET